MKIIPTTADKGNYLLLKGSWTKSGVETLVPIRTKEQRYWLDQAKLLTKGAGSLIPKNKSYKQQLKLYERLTLNAGFRKLHGLRHAYAQNRYSELTGWDCPLLGGKKRHQLSKSERVIDIKARTRIAAELSHSRYAIVAQYCG